MFGVLDLDESVTTLQADKQDISAGSTRPTAPVAGQMHFDTALTPPQPIWYSGSGWVDATGATV